MDVQPEPLNLTGVLLIAMPGVVGDMFAQTVVFLCAHGPNGAMGLIVNKPVPQIGLAEMLRQLKVTTTGAPEGELSQPIYFGGPVEPERGFVLHSPDYCGGEATLRVNDAFAMSSTMEILSDIGRGQGPAQAVMTLGYAGWAPGQLEAEISQNAWLTTDATPALVFTGPDSDKWTAALAELGVDPLSLSATAGHA
ncbi:YqgE/AlgH family protein [Roseicitreum antarcticum]|nr:YqgE/AlgH family protein [Roseicitreum antarcticum]